MTRTESPYTFKFFIFLSMAAYKPIMHSSYSVTLLVQSKSNLAVNRHYFPFGDIRTTPIPCPKALDAPSKYSFHESSLVDSSSIWKMAMRSSSRNSNFIGSYSSIVRYARNSAMTFLLITFWDTYWMSYSDNKTYHLVILLERDGFSKMYMMGSSFVISHTVWYNIYCLNR